MDFILKHIKILGAIAILVAVLGAISVGYLLFVGPRMRTQPNIRSFQARMPLTPPGVVPVRDPVPRLPSLLEVKNLKNPLKPTKENIARGKVYYTYYCSFCHGDTGRGDGPVGQSYTPKPTDLNSPEIKSYSDGRLLHAILAGPGHEPVLHRVILPDHRWYLVLYTRQF